MKGDSDVKKAKGKTRRNKNEVILKRSGYLEFRARSSNGIRVVKVFTSLPTFRVLAYCERSCSVIPLSLFADEFNYYTRVAEEEKE